MSGKEATNDKEAIDEEAAADEAAAKSLRELKFTAGDVCLAGLTDAELRVVTIGKGPSATLPPNAELEFNDLDIVDGTSDAGVTVTLGDIEAALVKQIKETLANGTVPQRTRGSLKIQ